MVAAPAPYASAIASSIPISYQTVKEAIREQELARLYNATHRPATVRSPPAWAAVHARTAQQFPSRPPATASKIGFPRAEDSLMQPLAITASATSSVGLGRDNAPGTPGSPPSALGGSQKSGLNHTSTYFYGEAPLKPELSAGNQYNTVGSNSMFGSQALSERQSSGAFGFGTSTREKAIRMYISPAHLKESYGRASPAPDTYTLQSSLGRQVLDQKVSYPARSFGMEDRFDRDRRDARAAQTPGPGAYRI